MALSSEAFHLVEATLDPPAEELGLVRLIEIQVAEEQLSGVGLGRRVGIDHGLWSKVRRNKLRFGVTTCAKIVEAYPHMRAAAARYLVDSYGRTSLELLEEAGACARLADDREAS